MLRTFAHVQACFELKPSPRVHAHSVDMEGNLGPRRRNGFTTRGGATRLCEVVSKCFTEWEGGSKEPGGDERIEKGATSMADAVDVEKKRDSLQNARQKAEEVFQQQTLKRTVDIS